MYLRAFCCFCDPDALANAAQGYQTLFHAAAHYPQSSRDIPGEVAYAEAQMGCVLEAARRAGVGRTLWEMVMRMVWPNSAVCPHCGGRD